MPATSLIVISDLHLADGHNILEGFRAQQQAALEGLLDAALPGGSLGNPSTTSLIINGDCFDFLAVPPYLEDGITTPQIALAKLEKIAAAHQPFFAALRHFLDMGGTITFLPGNHDIELCFREVRAQVTQLIEGRRNGGQRVHFCLDQSYRPLPDVYIEHGNQYDFWNYASGVWNEQGQALTPQPERITLPLGTQYMHRAAVSISIRYPYFDHFDPLIGTTRQIALLSLIDPEIVVEIAQRTVKMMSYPYQALQHLAPGDEDAPARLFAQAMPDFVAFQQDMHTHMPAWQTIETQLYTPAEREQSRAAALTNFFTLRVALEESTDAALKAIFHLTTPLDEGTDRGMHHILRAHPDLRIAIAGHTHSARHDQLAQGEQVYLNTSTWTVRLAPPVPEEITPEMVTWLRQPELEHFPVQDKTGYVFAWVNAEAGKPSTARLCVWEGGSAGSYRIVY